MKTIHAPRERLAVKSSWVFIMLPLLFVNVVLRKGSNRPQKPWLLEHSSCGLFKSSRSIHNLTLNAVNFRNFASFLAQTG